MCCYDHGMDHSWHLFDVEAGIEVRRLGDTYELRRTGHKNGIVVSAEEFNLIRETGTYPVVLNG